MNMVH